MAWDDMATPFVGTSVGGEAPELIEYHPSEGRARTISAVVDRDTEGLVGELGENAPQIVIAVANDPIRGIESRSVDTGGDQVKLAVRIGTAPVLRRITSIVGGHDTGMLMLGVH